MINLMDITVVCCDGRNATADLDVFSERLDDVMTIRVEYTLGDLGLTTIPDRDHDPDLVTAVATCGQCLADVREVVLYQRDCNREGN